MRIFPLLAIPTLLTLACAAQESKVVADFEQPGDLKQWEIKGKSGTLSDQHATHGRKSLRIAANEYIQSFRLPKDWSGFDSMDIDIFVESTDPVGVSLLIGDEAWNKASTYWNRHNGSFNLKPGANTLSIPVNGLYRGEAGSRNNDLKTNIDPKSIIRFDMGFNSKAKEAFLYVDNMRLVKESRPAGILAFDFGPESQAVAPGFTPISWNTVYGKNSAKAGLRHAQWSSNAARDDTFPTRLYQDFVSMADAEFVVDAPDGKYGCWLMFDDLGYWGGEQALFHKRWVESDGKKLWGEERSDEEFADYLFKFEKIEPKPGDNVWDVYMHDLFQAKRFEASATGGKLSLRFHSDGGIGCKVAALIVYPESIKADAEKWIAEVEDRNRKEFESRAVFMGPKTPSRSHPVSVMTVGYPTLEQDLSFYDAPGDPNPIGKLHRSAARGERISFTFAVQAPQEATGLMTLSATDLSGAAGTIPSSQIDLRYVHHALHRGYNDIAYSIGPESLRKVAGLDLNLSRGLTRQFWITVNVPADAKPGQYAGEAVLTANGAQNRLPLIVEVLDLALDEPDFTMGFYGTGLPSGLPESRRKAALRELCTIQKEFGMNSISGGPQIGFSGLAADGAPLLDFSACDEFMKTVKECGFTKELVAYGGPGMVAGLHDSNVVGNEGHAWEKKTGKTFAELLKIVWGAVKVHAEKEAWLPIAYEITDEPRVLDQARIQLELMKLYRDAVPFVKIGGSYSVNWGDSKDPFDIAVQEIFKTLSWSGLNSHNDTDLEKAKEYGRELHIYNQGTTRYSFGAYQWAESRKGIRGRMQWHLLNLHGYQFFDLDGREPDSAMINWGRDEIIPTIHLARCREGADDFRFAVTLWNMARKKNATPEAQAAIAWLEDVSKTIAIGKNTRPASFMDDETFRNTCIEHIKKVQAAK